MKSSVQRLPSKLHYAPPTEIQKRMTMPKRPVGRPREDGMDMSSALKRDVSEKK